MDPELLLNANHGFDIHKILIVISDVLNLNVHIAQRIVADGVAELGLRALLGDNAHEGLALRKMRLEAAHLLLGDGNRQLSEIAEQFDELHDVAVHWQLEVEAEVCAHRLHVGVSVDVLVVSDHRERDLRDDVLLLGFVDFRGQKAPKLQLALVLRNQYREFQRLVRVLLAGQLQNAPEELGGKR